MLRRTLLTAALLPLALLGCSDSSDPSPPSVVGTYAATIFVITPDGLHPVDYLAGGSTLSIAIAADSSVTGNLFVPGDLTGEDPFEADMAGSAIVDENSVTFDQAEDTFIRDLVFTRGDGSLTAEQELSSGDLYHIRLELVQ